MGIAVLCCITARQPALWTDATWWERTVCPRWDLHPRQPNLTVLATGANCCATGPPEHKGVNLQFLKQAYDEVMLPCSFVYDSACKQSLARDKWV